MDKIAVPKHKTFEFYPKKSRYCVIIPVINEGEKIRKQLLEMKEIARDIDLIICDGGSTDGSLDHRFLKSCNVRTLLVKTDTGKLGTQLRIAYFYALAKQYQGIVTIDGNGKDSIRSIYKFINELDQGWDYIQGSRFIKGGRAINTPLSRLIGIKLVHAPIISLLAHKRLTDTTNGFRAYSANYLHDKGLKPFRDVFKTYEILFYLSVKANRLGYRVKEIPVTRKYPKKGKIPTKISPLKGNAQLLYTLFKLALGRYNPSQ